MALWREMRVILQTSLVSISIGETTETAAQSCRVPQNHGNHGTRYGRIRNRMGRQRIQCGNVGDDLEVVYQATGRQGEQRQGEQQTERRTANSEQ